MQFIDRVRTMPANVRNQTFICDLYQLVGARGVQMLPEVPDKLFVLLIVFDDHAEKASSDLSERRRKFGGAGQQKRLVRLQQKQ